LSEKFVRLPAEKFARRRVEWTKAQAFEIQVRFQNGGLG
jgi:hypothetical protein